MPAPSTPKNKTLYVGFANQLLNKPDINENILLIIYIHVYIIILINSIHIIYNSVYLYYSHMYIMFLNIRKVLEQEYKVK